MSAAKLGDAWDAIVRKVPQYARDAAKGGNPPPARALQQGGDSNDEKDGVYGGRAKREG